MQPEKCSRTDIILDARMSRHSGIGTYVRGILEGFQGHPFFRKHSFGLAGEPSLSPHFSAGPRPDGLKTFSFHFPIYSLQEQLEYPFRLNRCRLWHAPHYNIPLFKRRETQLVVTIHDLIHWIFRKEFYSSLAAFYARIFFQRVAQTADRIIAVSHQTRDDLIQHFKAPPERIRVIPEGVAGEFFNPPASSTRGGVLAKYGLPKRFFLYVGLIKPHKNVRRLVEVFSKLRAEKKIESELLLVGKKDRKYPRSFRLLKDLQTRDGIHYLSEVASREELASLYASARALIHPSLYEGFGLTCLEAMASGTPVIVSQSASLPEVVGEAGYYIDPYSEASLREGLLELEENESLRASLAERGRKRAREFSWAKTAQATIQVYEELLS